MRACLSCPSHLKSAAPCVCVFVHSCLLLCLLPPSLMNCIVRLSSGPRARSSLGTGARLRRRRLTLTMTQKNSGGACCREPAGFSGFVFFTFIYKSAHTLGSGPALSLSLLGIAGAQTWLERHSKLLLPCCSDTRPFPPAHSAHIWPAAWLAQPALLLHCHPVPSAVLLLVQRHCSRV